jgi:hypothetical protein
MHIDEEMRPPPPAGNGSRPRQYADLVTDDFRLHRSLFTDPKIFNKEMDRIFAGTWVYLLHESEIAVPNDFRCGRSDAAR